MKNIIKNLWLVNRLVLSAGLVFLMAQCAEEETLLATASNQDEVAYEAATSAEEKSTVPSLTISGVHTIMSESADCSTCTFVVSAKTHLIDGTVLNIKPGSVICLDKAIRYELLEFENLQGTAENPIIIAYCGE